MTNDRKKTRYQAWMANSGSTTPTLLNGHSALTIAGGTATARTSTYNSRSTRVNRLGYVSAASAGQTMTFRVPTAKVFLADDFVAGFRFAIKDPLAVATSRMFLGIAVSAAALTNVEPSTLLNVFGIGHGNGDANLMVYSANASTGNTPVDLGSPFIADPTDFSAANFFDFDIFTMSEDSPYGGLAWRATAYFDGISPVVRSGYIDTPTPARTSAFTSFTGFRSNNVTAKAVALDLSVVYNEAVF